MLEIITSIHNPLIKNIRKLQEKSAARREENLFVAEGVRECSLMQQNGYELIELLVCKNLYKPQLHYPVSTGGSFRAISEEVYESIAYRGSSEGIIALARPKTHSLQELRLSTIPLMLVLDGIEKPGNIGAMLRTCDAVACDAVIICNAKVDLYNPNVIRSSLGTVFTNSIALCSWDDAFAFFQNHNIKTFAAHLHSRKKYFECDFKSATAIVMGAEATGISEEVMMQCSEQLIIPMNGKIDSLNVSVSAGILLYEAQRQRNY